MASNNQRRFLERVEELSAEPDVFGVVDKEEDLKAMEFAKIIDKPKGPLFILFMLSHPNIKFSEGTRLYVNISDENPSILIVHQDGTFTVEALKRRGLPESEYRVKSLWKAVNLTGNKGNSGWNNVYIRKDTFRGSGRYQSMNDYFFSCWEYIKDTVDVDLFMTDERLYGYLIDKGMKAEADNLYISDAEKDRRKKLKEAKVKDHGKKASLPAPKKSTTPKPEQVKKSAPKSNKPRPQLSHLSVVRDTTIKEEDRAPLEGGSQDSLFND